jgi:hypothetical protein
MVVGFLFFSGHSIVNLLYDRRYYDAGHMVEALSIGLIEIRTAISIQCFLALGKSKLLMPSSFIKLVIIFSMVPITFNLWGLDGALWVIGGSSIFPFLLVSYLNIKNKIFDIKLELITIPSILIGALIGCFFNKIIKYFYINF